MLMRKGQDSLEPVPGQKGKKKTGKEDLSLSYLFFEFVSIITIFFIL
jgi:hypothetical protein